MNYLKNFKIILKKNSFKAFSLNMDLEKILKPELTLKRILKHLKSDEKSLFSKNSLNLEFAIMINTRSSSESYSSGFNLKINFVLFGVKIGFKIFFI